MTPAVIPEAAWQAMGWAMLHFAWAGTLVGVLFFGIERVFLRNAASGVRYAQGLVCLLALVLTAGLCVWHEWPTERLLVEAAEAPVASAGSLLPSGAQPMTAVVSYPVDAPIAEAEIALVAEEEAFQWVTVLPWVWLGGVALLAAHLLFGLAGTWRLRSGATSSGATAMQGRCDALRMTLGISRKVAVAVSERVKAPLMVGVLRPLIILPASALSGMSPAMVEWILLHELAHVRRWDNAVIVFQRLIECLLFFHPCVWIASRWIDREREFCCDRYALAKNREADPIGYARTLAALAGVPGMAFGSTMASHAVLRRIRRILDEEPSPRRGGGAVVGALLGIALAAGFFWTTGPSVAEAQSTERVQEEPTSPDVAEPDVEKVEAAPSAPPALVEEPAEAETPIEAANSEPVESKPDDRRLVARSYRVPPNLVDQLPGEGSLQARLEGMGIAFPEGTFAIFDPPKSTVGLYHTEATAARFAKEIELRAKSPGPQVYLTSRFQLDRGGDVKMMKAPSVVTLSGQRAKIEDIRELIYPTNAPGEEPFYEMTPVGLEIEFDPVAKMTSLDIEVSGSVQIRLLKGTDLDGFFEKPQDFGFDEFVKKEPKRVMNLNPLRTTRIERRGPAPVPKFDQRPEFELYRQPFKTTIKSGQSLEIKLADVPGRGALLKRKRVEPGVLSATLTVQLIGVSGEEIDSPETLRAAYPPFKLGPGILSPAERADGERAYSAGLAAYDVGDLVYAKLCARRALIAAPGNADRLALWKKVSAAKPKRRQQGLPPGAWLDRSYRLRAPLMPEGSAVDPAKLAEFLKQGGMAMPPGATATMGDDGVTLNVHNLGREIEALETALMDRVISFYVGGWVMVSVDLCRSVERKADWLGAGDPSVRALVPESFSIAGVLTDPQYQAVRAKAAKQVAIESLPRRRLLHDTAMDVLDGSSFQEERVRWQCDMEAQIDFVQSTIEAKFSPELVEVDQNGDAIFSTRKLAAAITVWDGQWIVLSKKNTDGSDDLMFVRIGMMGL